STCISGEFAPSSRTSLFMGTPPRSRIGRDEETLGDGDHRRPPGAIRRYPPGPSPTVQGLPPPPERLERPPRHPLAPHHAGTPDGDGTRLRVHYVDEGPRGADPVLLLHGEPSWSYLYRKMIPVLVAAGHRAVAPDLVGFGRSDKPAARADYSYQRHVDWLRATVHALALRDITLVCQDWGGLLGLRLV